MILLPSACISNILLCSRSLFLLLVFLTFLFGLSIPPPSTCVSNIFVVLSIPLPSSCISNIFCLCYRSLFLPLVFLTFLFELS
ncbi:MAG: hypothetical protein BYD32DRAFT_186474 [Podila humilis]|nr:MAG: hypothetical protein BYD32DRAFT_186474 [Podila humilis]